MKTLLTGVLAAALAAPGLASAADLTGAWKLVITAGDMTFNISCNMTEQGAALTGTCTPVGVDDGQPIPFTGTVNGSAAKWAYDVDTGGAQPMHLDFAANIRSDTAMAGAIITGANAVTFTATKQ